jgi:hypothetical protein
MSTNLMDRTAEEFLDDTTQRAQRHLALTSGTDFQHFGSRSCPKLLTRYFLATPGAALKKAN